MAPTKLIIDTDPGIDDVQALLLALAADPEEFEIELISITCGNVKAKFCLRNVLSLFHVIQSEVKYRQARGLPSGFAMLERRKPKIAVGALAPLGSREMAVDNFHGKDGLGGIYEQHPHLTIQEEWEHLFNEPSKTSQTTAEAKEVTRELTTSTALFTPSQIGAHEEILSILAANPPGTVTIVTLAPLTTVAIAAATDPKTFLRVKSLAIMGGAIDVPGNITPRGEFNFYADALAAARVFALTNRVPASTMPPNDVLPDYPSHETLGDNRLDIALFPLDITDSHFFQHPMYSDHIKAQVETESPLATFGSFLYQATYNEYGSRVFGVPGVVFPDPVCIWYALEGERNPEQWSFVEEDVRVETAGQWSLGSCVADRRPLKKLSKEDISVDLAHNGDGDEWLSQSRRNRVRVCKRTPGREAFTEHLLRTIYG